MSPDKSTETEQRRWKVPCPNCDGDGWVDGALCPHCESNPESGDTLVEVVLANQGLSEEKLRHFESEMRAANELARQHPIDSPLRVRYTTEFNVYDYVLRRLASTGSDEEKGGGDSAALNSVPASELGASGEPGSGAVSTSGRGRR